MNKEKTCNLILNAYNSMFRLSNINIILNEKGSTLCS